MIVSSTSLATVLDLDSSAVEREAGEYRDDSRRSRCVNDNWHRTPLFSSKLNNQTKSEQVECIGNKQWSKEQEIRRNLPRQANDNTAWGARTELSEPSKWAKQRQKWLHPVHTSQMCLVVECQINTWLWDGPAGGFPLIVVVVASIAVKGWSALQKMYWNEWIHFCDTFIDYEYCFWNTLIFVIWKGITKNVTP